jgi:hypothetical protein
MIKGTLFSQIGDCCVDVFEVLWAFSQDLTCVGRGVYDNGEESLKGE